MTCQISRIGNLFRDIGWCFLLLGYLSGGEGSSCVWAFGEEEDEATWISDTG